MSEAILKALMQLFALIGDIHDDTVITGRERDVVKAYLKRHLNNELIARYMDLFEEYLGLFNSEKIVKGSLQDRKRISLNAMRILSICEKINEELQQKQKVYVLIRLIDYIASGSEITDTELDFLETVGTSFNISQDEICNIRGFIMNHPDKICDKKNVLICSGSLQGNKDFRYFANPGLKGKIMFLLVQSTNTFIMRYSGNESLSINGQPITEGESYVFDHGSSIRGQGIKAIYYSEIVRLISSTPDEDRIHFDAVNVTFRFGRSENGIHDLNYHGESGELTGIIGGSGVGKSTALSIMNGSLKPHRGKVLINGHVLYSAKGREKLKGVIGYVPQDDLLIEELTVFQNLYYNARMCLGNLSDNEIIETVNKILGDLDLFEIKDLKVGSVLNKVISGGQRKRINIALELIREPTILFVDEPTSGLSSVDSEMVMNLLKDLTYKGKLVIVNIHQPSSEIFKMFDNLMIIDRGGYQVYFGNPSEAIIYFKLQTNHANPYEDQCATCGNVDTEKILQIMEAKVVDEHGRPTRIRKVSPGEWARRFRETPSPGRASDSPAINPLPANNYSIPGLFRQSVIFFIRDLLAKISDKQYLLITLLGPPVLAFILAWFTRTSSGEEYSFSRNDNIPPYLFMCVITSLFFGLMGSSEEIIGDRKILRRESFLHLSWFSYLNSKVMILFIISAIQTLFFVITGNMILEIRGMTFTYWLILFTTSCFGNILGLNLSSAFRSVITVYIIIPFIIIPQLLFSGVLVRFDKLHLGSGATHEFVPVPGDLMIARWAFEALAVEQFTNNRYEKLFFRYNVDLSGNEWKSQYLIENLKSDLRLGRIYRDSSEYSEEVNNRLGKINKYLVQLSPGFYNGREAIPGMMGFDDEIYKKTLNRLDSLKHVFNAGIRNSRHLIDSVSNSYETGWLAKLKSDYRNERLKTLMLDEESTVKIYETDNKIIRKFQPGYMKAESKTGRAHFYAPEKRAGNMEIGTCKFNICVIWLVSLILYLLLYLKVPDRITILIEKARFTGD